MVDGSEGALAVIVFDFDGTLVDSAVIKRASFMYALGAGQSVDQASCDLAYAMHGTINRTELLALSFNDIYGRRPHPDEHEKLVDDYTRYFRHHMNEVAVFPGLSEFYQRFGRRYQLMISSNAPQVEIVELCDKLGMSSYFRRVYGFPVSKHAALTEIKGSFGNRRGSVLYVGDRPEDGAIASKVGVPFFRLDPGFHSPSTTEGIGRSLGELAEAICALDPGAVGDF